MDKMCPDKQFLSVYYDGELPSPWKERMERHLETCSECRKRIDIYRETSCLIKDGEAADVMETVKGRIWRRITAGGIVREPFLTVPPHGRRRFLPPRISQAVASAAAGAAVAVAVICIMLLVTGRRNDAGAVAAGDNTENFAGMAVSSDYELNIPEIAPDMHELIRYLENDDSSNIVIIRLPERKKFSRYGEPAFINAADYNRSPKN
jgi:hypothetical protein